MPVSKPDNTDGTHKQAKVKCQNQIRFEGMNIGLIKVIPSPTGLFLFTLINLPFATPVSRLLQSGNKTEGECTVVHGIEIRFMNSIWHQREDFWGKTISSPLIINEFLMQTNYIGFSKNLAN